jgi:hypothetical protein
MHVNATSNKSHNQSRISYIDTKWKRRVIKIEQGVFTQLVFGTNGGDGQRMYRVSQNVGIEAREKI